MLVSPAEHDPRLAALGSSSLLTEENGVDFMWGSEAAGGLVGVQRKEFKDFVSSVGDGRLQREVAQMAPLKMALLIIEGRPRWTLDGELVDRWARMTRMQMFGLTWSLMLRGIMVSYTDDIAGTVDAIRGFEVWSKKEKHDGLDRRPGPQGKWGHATSTDFQLHMLQGLPGMGPRMAKVVLAHFGGVLPIAWTVDINELLAIDGVGVGRARKWLDAFSGGSAESANPQPSPAGRGRVRRGSGKSLPPRVSE